MSLVCGQCSRVNPPEAAYCYHDGAALAGRAGGPINAGAAPFPNQFVFPDGLACRNFDQLALACQQNWASALSLLQKGFLGSFFGGMGRVDLAMAAQEAANFPDRDRGLDQLLGKMPTQALQNPKMQAEPSEINIGQMKIGENRASELHLTNLGMRLLFGTVTSDCEWLTVGDGSGHSEKMFQFQSETVIPVHVRGQHLRAGNKPLEGHLIIDSNAGEPITVTFKADVPVTPYPDGPFAGALTPRQISETAKKNVKLAIPLFERGDVAKWYASNGWKYPVQGPIMPGKGSIQQFFEALGVGKPPKVDFSPKSLDLSGAVGKTVEATIEVTSADKKVVYAWATCEQPWVEVGKNKVDGASASIPITVRIPNPCPPSIDATIQVHGNGNQKTAIPLKVKVAGGKAGVVLKPVEEEFAPVEIIDDDAPVVVILDEPTPTSPKVAEEPVVVMMIDEPAPAPTPSPNIRTGQPSAFTPAPTPKPVTPAADDSPFSIPDDASPLTTSTVAKPSGGRLPLPVRLLIHSIPLGVLFICMIVLLVHDIWWAGKATGAEEDAIDQRPFVEVVFDEGRQKGKANYTDSMTFAVHRIDPDNKGNKVKLNWYENGFGNSTVLKIDGADKAFGYAPEHGKWAVGSDKGTVTHSTQGKFGGKTRTFDMDNGISVTQTVTIEPGEPVETPPGSNIFKRKLDTVLVRYKIENLDGSKKTHSVGLRVLLDTCIGDNDGAAFTLPGVYELVTTSKKFDDEDVPDFVQVLQNSDKETALRDPGIVMQLNLRFSDKLEYPGRFLLTRYPGNDRKNLHKWDVPLVDMKKPDDPKKPDEPKDPGDSSVVIYWDAKDLAYKKTREMAYTYGLGTVAVSENKTLGLTIGGSKYVKGEFTVVALVSDPNAKTVTLELPPGLKLSREAKEPLEQKIEHVRADASNTKRATPVTWHVVAEREGRFNITARTSTGATQSRRVTITASSLFN